MQLEQAGVPTVTVVTDQFFALAEAERASRGMAALPLIKVPHPIGTLPIDKLHRAVEAAVDAIVAPFFAGASQPMMANEHRISALEGSGAAVIAAPSSSSAFFDFMVARGWTDGLPVLPPTRDAVAAMLDTSGLRADDVLGTMPPLNGNATVDKIAANAVMAGCLPEYFPLVLAAVQGILQPGFNLDGVQTTTGNIAPVVIINGPCRTALDINSGANVLGQGWRANATIGRAIRLVMTNIGGAIPGLYDKSTMGQPAKYTFCFAENEEESPWEPLHVERGLVRESDAVSMFGCSGVNSAVDMASQSAPGLLKTFALTMIGGLTSGVTSTEVMMVLCPEHAALLHAGGYSKDKLRERLFELARIRHDKFSDENLELLSKRRPLWFDNGSREIGAVDRPEDIWLVVAGGAGAKSAYIPGRTGTRLQTSGIG